MEVVSQFKIERNRVYIKAPYMPDEHRQLFMKYSLNKISNKRYFPWEFWEFQDVNAVRIILLAAGYKEVK